MDKIVKTQLLNSVMFIKTIAIVVILLVNKKKSVWVFNLSFRQAQPKPASQSPAGGWDSINLTTELNHPPTQGSSFELAS